MTIPTKNAGEHYIRKQTFWLVTILALAVGFFGGVVFATFKSEKMPLPGRKSTPPPPPRAAEPDRSGMIAALEQETQTNPQNAEAWTQLGNEFFDSDQYEKAIQAYSKSLDLNPNNADVWTDLGIMYRRSGKPEEAIKKFDRAIEADPKHEIARLNKGIVLLHDLKDTDGALKAWEELIEINPIAMAPTGRSVDEMVQQLKKQKVQQESAQ